MPYQVSIRAKSDGSHCGGSIINNKYILTAAHCFNDKDDKKASNITVKVGFTTQNNPGSNLQSYKAKRIVIHPSYNDNVFNKKDFDVAIIEIDGTFTFNNFVQPVELISNQTLSAEAIGNKVRVSGWGWTVPRQRFLANHLQAVDVSIISNQVADKQLDIAFANLNPPRVRPKLTQRMISTGAVGTNRQGACHGDSGGPLIYKKNGQNDIQIGVVSWGVPECVGGKNSPSIYARLSQLVGWINSEAWKFANIRGNSIVCYNSSQTFTLQNVPYFITATDWQTSPNLTIVSSNNNSVTVRAKSSNATGNGWVKATLSNGIVLTETFRILARPVIKFADTSLTEALLNPGANTTVNYDAVTLHDGSKIPFTVEGSYSFQWKNTRYASLPELDEAPPGVHVYLDRSSIKQALQIPYTGCYDVLNRRANNSLPPTSASRLLDYYFIQPPANQVSRNQSEPIKLSSSSFGVVEVELTATNACGCVSEANHYLVNVVPSRSPSRGHWLTASPNPANVIINLQLNAIVPPPESESPEPNDAISQQMRIAANEACCRKFMADPLSDIRPNPECCQYGQQLPSRPLSFPGDRSEVSPPETSPESFSYYISIRHYLTGVVRYTQSFTLKEGDSKKISLNVSAWPKGLYVLNMDTSNGRRITKTIVIR